MAVDRLNIVAHDRFEEIIKEANRSDSPIRLQAVILTSEDLGKKTQTVVSLPTLANKLGLQPEQPTALTQVVVSSEASAFQTPEEQKVAQIAYEVIRTLENKPNKLPSVSFLNTPEIQAELVNRVASKYRPQQLEIEVQIFYKQGADHLEYQPDFVAEVKDTIYMLEPKARGEMESPEVLAKKEAAIQWCGHASEHALTYSGKPWKYVLIPHDEIAENVTLAGLASRFG